MSLNLASAQTKVITGSPAAFHAVIPPRMCAEWSCPAASRFSAAASDRLPVPQWKITRR